MNKKLLTKWQFMSLLVIAIVLIVIIKLQIKRPSNENIVSLASPFNSSITAIDSQAPEISPSPQTTNKNKVINVQEIVAVPSEFNYSVEVPAEWEAEAITSIGAINFYLPAAPAKNRLEQSQIFVRFFKANDFLTLKTVNIIEQVKQTIKNRPAVRYVIEKKSTVANFAEQPLWRNQQHVVTDIRLTDSNPSIFYVIAKNPSLDPTIYQHFLDTLILP